MHDYHEVDSTKHVPGEHSTDSDQARIAVVEELYEQQHANMTVEFVESMHSRWLPLDHGEYSIKDVVDKLDAMVDNSTWVVVPNSVHDFQTAERIRKGWPEPEYDWFHLVGLLHDLGKVMALWGSPQWAVVGDTFPVGCKHSDKIVFPWQFERNSDSRNPEYSSDTGMYEAHCGLDNLVMAWGHDEYMYQMLTRNGCMIPEEGLAIIRFHSFFAWHTHGAYKHLTTEYDEEVILPWVQEFNKFDVHTEQACTEDDAIPDCKALWEGYYKPLCEKYGVGGLLSW